MPVRCARREQIFAGQFEGVMQSRGAMEKLKVQSSKFKGSSKPQASIPNGLRARLGVLSLGFPLSFELRALSFLPYASRQVLRFTPYDLRLAARGPYFLLIAPAALRQDGTGFFASEEAAEKVTVAKKPVRSEEHTSELQSRVDLVCRLLLEKKKNNNCYI